MTYTPTEKDAAVIRTLETRIAILKPLVDAVMGEVNYARDEKKISMLQSSFTLQYFHGADSLLDGLQCMEAALHALKTVGINGVVGVPKKKTPE